MAKTADKKKAAVETGAATPEDKRKALDTAIAKIEKDFGKGSIIKMSGEAVQNVETVSSGSLTLDLALGVGGYPRGRIIEIYGPESSGKTTLTLHAVAEVQKLGGIAAFIDAEHAIDPEYAKNLGVNLDDLLISQPNSGEEALEICDQLVRSGAVDLVVIDSVAALVPQAEIDGEMGASHVGLQARLMSQALRKLSGTISKTKTMVIFINQLREKVGVMYGNPETTTGGRALKFYASVRIDIRRGDQLKDKQGVFGNRTKCKVVKNKVAPPFKTAEFDILFGKGISKISEIFDAAETMGIIDKSGAWFYYNSERIGQGRENAKAFVEGDPSMLAEIEAKVREGLKNHADELAPEELAEIDDEDIDSLFGEGAPASSDENTEGLDINMIDLGEDDN